MLEAVYNALWKLGDIVVGAISYVMCKHSDNLIICLITVNHTEATNWAHLADDITVNDVALSKHADIEWVTVTNNVGTSTLLHTILRYAVSTKALRNKAIEGWNNV